MLSPESPNQLTSQPLPNTRDQAHNQSTKLECARLLSQSRPTVRKKKAIYSLAIVTPYMPEIFISSFYEYAFWRINSPRLIPVSLYGGASGCVSQWRNLGLFYTPILVCLSGLLAMNYIRLQGLIMRIGPVCGNCSFGVPEHQNNFRRRGSIRSGSELHLSGSTVADDLGTIVYVKRIGAVIEM